MADIYLIRITKQLEMLDKYIKTLEDAQDQLSEIVRVTPSGELKTDNSDCLVRVALAQARIEYNHHLELKAEAEKI